MGEYRKLTQEKRYGISTLMQKGHNKKKITEAIGVHQSTISRELRRNPDLAGQADRGKQGFRGISPKKGPRSGQSPPEGEGQGAYGSPHLGLAL